MEGSSPCRVPPLPPQHEQGIWQGRDLVRASDRAPITPRIRVLTRRATASLPEDTQLLTVISDAASSARIACPVPRTVECH